MVAAGDCVGKVVGFIAVFSWCLVAAFSASVQNVPPFCKDRDLFLFRSIKFGAKWCIIEPCHPFEPMFGRLFAAFLVMVSPMPKS